MASAAIVFVDTSVLLYASDVRVPDKQKAAANWLAWCWQQQAGRISTQVLNELYVNLRRLAPSMSVNEARAFVRRYRAWAPWVVEESTVDEAWALQDRFQFSYCDALMVAAALHQRCTVLLTEDLQHGLQVDGLQILSPFHAPVPDSRSSS